VKISLKLKEQLKNCFVTLVNPRTKEIHRLHRHKTTSQPSFRRTSKTDFSNI